MIKLTALHYKLTIPALEKFHNISQHNEGILFEWEQEVESARATGVELPKKPFIEPFEFEEDDYNITEQAFRIRKEDILYYKTNLDGFTELTIAENLAYTIKESVEEIDRLIEELG